MSASGSQKPCTKQIFEITEQDLPLSCPMPQFRLWDAHPRVFLPIQKTGHETCPYCGTQYVLKGFKAQAEQS